MLRWIFIFYKSYKFRCWRCKSSGAPSTCETSQAQERCDCCLWQAFWGENGHLCNSNDWILASNFPHPSWCCQWLSTAIPTQSFWRTWNRAGWKEVHEDPTGKLPTGFLQHRRVRGELVVVLQSCPSHHRCCLSGRTTSASWIHRNPEFPGVTRVSSQVSLVFLVTHAVKEHNLKSDWKAMGDQEPVGLPRKRISDSLGNTSSLYQLWLWWASPKPRAGQQSALTSQSLWVSFANLLSDRYLFLF